MSDAIVSNAVAYSLQVAWLAFVASLLPLLLRVGSATLRYRYWRSVLAISLLLPWLQGREHVHGAIGMSFGPPAVVVGVAATTSNGLPIRTAFPWLSIVIAIVVGGIVLRLAALGVGMMRVRRMRMAGAIAPPSALSEELQAALGTHAEIRYVATLEQPVTFGLRRPIVLLPETVRGEPEAIQRAVLCHELLHVKRRDWVWVIAEAIVRAVLWFHPGVWWLIARVQLAREEVVDERAVTITGQRKAYVEALMAFADRPQVFAAAAAFSRRRHLFRRMMLIAKEGAMSWKRVVVSSVVMAAFVLAGMWYGTVAFPLKAVAAAQDPSDGPGPLERAARPITPENPVPRRTYSVNPTYPAELAAAEARAALLLRVTLDESGHVAEVRRVAVPMRGGLAARGSGGGATSAVDAMIDSLTQAAIDAIRQWQYEPPADGPISFDVTVAFDPSRTAVVIAPNTPRGPTAFTPPPPPPPPGPSPWPDAIRLGKDAAKPRLLKRVNPIYPQEAQDAHIQGIVVLEARIETDGKISDVRVIDSIPELDDAAIEAVKQWEYEPALLNGQRVPVAMRITIRFTLT